MWVHYFEESKVVGLLRMLTGFGEIEIVFDSVSKSGMAMMRKKYMKQVGHGDAFRIGAGRENRQRGQGAG